MTALDDAIAKADEVLADEEDRRIWQGSDRADRTLPRHQTRALDAAPDLARALKAVAEALDEATAVSSSEQYGRAVRSIRAAIERRLTGQR